MNIFYLHEDPKTCAEMHCDKHVVKMILEYAQLLSTAHHVLDGEPSIECYKMTHKNHPSAIWARQTSDNYLWLHDLLCKLCAEYTVRYHKKHKVERSGLLERLSQLPTNIVNDGTTPMPQCMPDDFKVDNDSVSAYKKYYLYGKRDIAVWKYTDQPDWWFTT